MVDIKKELELLMTKLQQERQELQVKVHLAGMDAKDKWEEMEGSYEKLRGRMKAAGEEAEEVSEDVWSAAKLLGDEIIAGYRSIRDKL